MVIRRCTDDSDVCVPTEKYCDRHADCPSGSDESDCSCGAWGMISCDIDGVHLCVYPEWIQIGNASADSCEKIVVTGNTELKNKSEYQLKDCVKVSVEGVDEFSCLTFPFINSCRSLEYPLQFGANILCLFGNLYDKTEKVLLNGLHKYSPPVGNIIIKGYSTESSLQRYEIFLSSSHIKLIQTFVFVNLTINESNLNVWNVDLIFIGCTLRNVFIKNGHNSTSSIHALITLDRSTFVCNDKGTGGIDLTQRQILKLYVSHSEINGCPINLYVGDMILSVNDSYIFQSDIKLVMHSYVRVPTIIKLVNTTFINTGTWYFSEYKPGNHHIYLDVIGCIFLRTSLSLRIHTLTMSINNTDFLHSFKRGTGGALIIIASSSTSEVMISQCNFEQNVVVKGNSALDETSGQGGALYIKGNFDAIIDLNIYHSLFKDNFASVTGAALYIGVHVTASLLQCTFINYIDRHHANLKTILYSEGTIESFQGNLVVNSANSEVYSGTYNILETEDVHKIMVNVQCPNWYVHHTAFTENNRVLLWFVEKRLKQFSYKCQPCPDGYYTTSANKGKFDYPPGENNFTTIHHDITSTTCVKCPYGASCPGYDVVPRQNYWGYWHEGVLSFQACPAGYCCSGNDRAPCSRFDSCAGNRTGVLCGACHDNFSISILDGKCTPDSQCQGDKWFWAFAVLVTIIYALWYTFKDDMFGILFTALKNLRWHGAKRITSNTGQMKSNDGDSIVKSTSKNSKKTSKQSIKQEPNPDIGPGTHQDGSNRSKMEENIDKGYFGIVTFFVQMSAAMTIHIEFEKSESSKSLLDTITQNIGNFLGMQFSEVSIDACPFVRMTIAGKNAFQFIFLSGIYVNWFMIFICSNSLSLFGKNYEGKVRTKEIVKLFKLKMVQGLIEIIKYTYSGFCGLIFMSLVCVKLGSEYVWWYDATNKCLENWQILMVILGIIYAAPFPLTLLTAMRMLIANYIGAWEFILCCLFQPFGLYYTIGYRRHRNLKDNAPKTAMSEEAKAIISVLQGPYREDEKNVTLYWEAMVSLRRLLITIMTLIGSASIRMVIITGFCILFLVQHIYTVPFKAKQSNHVETMSLVLLSFVAVINSLKSILTDSGTIPTGPSVSFFKGLEFTEHILLVTLLAFIAFVEIKGRAQKKGT